MGRLIDPIPTFRCPANPHAGARDHWTPGRSAWGWWCRFKGWLESWASYQANFGCWYRRWLGRLLGGRKGSVVHGGTHWPAGYPMPRRCSYCCGAHPEDVIALVRLGWTSEGTDGGCKFYLYPPGYLEWTRQLFSGPHFSDPSAAKPPEPGNRLLTQQRSFQKSPVPCLKMYLDHFDGDALRRLVEAHREYRKAKGVGGDA